MQVAGSTAAPRLTWSSVRRPRANDEGMRVRDAFAMYYRALPVPVAVVVVMSVLDLMLSNPVHSAPTFWSPSLAVATGLGASGSWMTPLLALAALVLYPVTGLLNAAIIHCVGKWVVRRWSGTFAQTFAAVIFGMFPVAVMLWILSIPLASPPLNAVVNLLFLSTCLGSAAVTVGSLAAQHRITVRRALAGWVPGMAVVFFTMAFYFNYAITVGITVNTLKTLF